MTIYNNIYSGVPHKTHRGALAMDRLKSCAALPRERSSIYIWNGRRVHHMGGGSVGSRSEREFVLFHSSQHNERVNKWK